MKKRALRIMVFDTNVVIEHIRRNDALPSRAIIPVVVVGELESFALKADWGYQKVTFMRSLFERFPIVDITREIAPVYARIDAFIQGKLKGLPLSPGLSARNMGKNDIWIASIALFLDLELHTTDHDFNHLPPLGIRLKRY